jgi:hypothetical protein
MRKTELSEGESRCLDLISPAVYAEVSRGLYGNSFDGQGQDNIRQG